MFIKVVGIFSKFEFIFGADVFLLFTFVGMFMLSMFIWSLIVFLSFFDSGIVCCDCISLHSSVS